MSTDKDRPTGLEPAEPETPFEPEAPFEPAAAETPVAPDQPAGRRSQNEYAGLQAEAGRLLEFKRQSLARRNQARCPSCTTYVHIETSKCPHCGSDIAAHMALAREELRKLDKITTELYRLQKSEMERREERSHKRPLREWVTSFLADPQLREDAKIILPSLVLFFALVVALRFMANGALFWAVSIIGGAFAYMLLMRSSFRRRVTVDLYRAVLVVGLVIVLSNAVAIPASDSGAATRVEVQKPVVNIRASATTDSDVVTTAARGDRLTVVDRQGDWYKIETKGGETGWVYADLVK